MSFITDNVANRDPILVTVGVTQPSLFDTITLDGQTIGWVGGDVVTFFMRPLLSRTPSTNSASAVILIPATSEGFNVRYDWQIADVAIEGQYMGWWGYQHAGSPLAETPEFRIFITDHGPGFGAATGVVVDGVSQFLPTTLRALREDPNFGDRFLQQHADYVKRVVMGSVVTPDLEVDYDPILVEYLSKRTAVRLIAPAKDYWARQYRQVVTQGPYESGSYPDMLKNLDDLHHRLCCELPQDWLQLQQLVPGLPQRRVEPAPASSLGDASDPRNGPVTGDPSATPPARTGGPRWGTIFMP